VNDPQAILASIPGFETARISGRRSDGPTNESWAVERGGERFVLRLDKPEAARLGLDRASEKDVCEALADAGLAPRPVHFDAEAGVYLRPYLPGRSWTPRDLGQKENLERLALLLRRLHALPAVGRAFKPLKAAGRYARQIGTVDAAKLFEEAALAHTLIEPHTPVLCHNDLFCENIIEGDGLTLIDWEYAGLGDPYFDLAIVVQHHGLESGLAGHLLRAYLQGEPDREERVRLAKQCRFYLALLDLWNLRVGAT
jgi:thiamine kinase